MSYSAMTEEEIEALMDLPMLYSRSGGEFIAQLTEAAREAETAKMVARQEEEDWAQEVARAKKTTENVQLNRGEQRSWPE